MAKKKGPPYTDDPGCKFIVIDDPWPGNAAGRDRKDAYWNLLGAWVWYMLDKKEIPDTIYSVNTRAEVIVRLPEQVDIEPILGAHAWITFLHHGAEADRHRVSCIFEYNYRIKGDPAYHNWAEHMPIGGEPPANRRFPVKFPYPPPGWASPAHKNSRDISLSLPPTRERVPVVDVPVVDPSGAANNVHPPTPVARTEVTVEPEATQEEQPAQAHVAKPDPYEEEDVALQFVKQEPVDSDVRAGRRTEGEVKQEPTDVPVKREEIPEPQHSAEYLAEFERYRLHTSISQGTGEETTAQSESINDGVERIGDPLLHAHRSHSSNDPLHTRIKHTDRL
ncbi:hypothetical protein B0H21DRAFT_739662 [Amylocystis lapponica]|nr:hypothetical protein B0H21DRAFT_739662 [Amylocystis lapponica]